MRPLGLGMVYKLRVRIFCRVVCPPLIVSMSCNNAIFPLFGWVIYSSAWAVTYKGRLYLQKLQKQMAYLHEKSNIVVCLSWSGRPNVVMV